MPQVRVIGADGEQLGILHPREAVRQARELGLDLVEVAPNADPPVCRIIDFGKYQYEAKKKAHEAKKNQVVIVVKEIKFRPATDDHDYDYRIKHSRDWLNEGNKVRATIFFRGREMSHRDLGYKILERVKKDLSDIGDVEVMPKMEGNQLFIIIAPKRQKVVVKAEPKPKPAAAAPKEVVSAATEVAPTPTEEATPKPAPPTEVAIVPADS